MIVDLFRWAVHLNASTNVLKHVDVGFPTLDLTSLQG